MTYGVPSGGLIAVTVQIDEWTYDFGPMQFMEEITFENGVMRSSRPMGYGTARGQPAPGKTLRGDAGVMPAAPTKRRLTRLRSR